MSHPDTRYRSEEISPCEEYEQTTSKHENVEELLDDKSKKNQNKIKKENMYR